MHKKVKYIAIFLVLFAVIVIPFTYSKYIKKYTKQLSISARQPTYSVVFDANGGSGTMSAQTFTYKTPQALSPNEFTNLPMVFDKWNTEADGSGDPYDNEEVVDKLVKENGGSITLYAQWVNKAARIGDTYYDTLADAIDAVFPSSPQTTIVLLKDVTENVQIDNGVDIILDLNHNTIHNDGNDNDIKNYGHLYLKNGNVHNTAATNGAVNNYNTGVLIVDNVHIYVDGTGNRQAIWNNKGNATIKGGSILTSVAVDRPCVTNVGGGTMLIEDAYIESYGAQGLINEGTLTLGTNDTDVLDEPVIIGYTVGLQATHDLNYYDGIFKGRNSAVNDESRLKNTPTDYVIVSGTEDIDGVTYYTKHLEEVVGVPATVTFNANSGNCGEATRTVMTGDPLGTLPVATKANNDFVGWFDDPTNGTQYFADTIINGDVILYAHFTPIVIARVNGTDYLTLQAAINAVTNNTPTIITLERDTTEKITVNNGKEITIDLNSHTINNNGNNNVVVNNGTLTLTNGTVHTNAAQGAINQEDGVLNIIDAEVISVGERQAIYATGGVLNISGNSYLSSEATGTSNSSTMPRATISILPNSTVNITGGTIVANKTVAISNEGILTIGTMDGSVDITTPVVQGKTYGIRTVGTLNIYDGIFKGVTTAINGTVTAMETGTSFVNDTEVIDTDTYNVAYLQ